MHKKLLAYELLAMSSWLAACLFCSQRFRRICDRRFYRLETNGDQGNQYCRYTSYDKCSPANMYPVCKIL